MCICICACPCLFVKWVRACVGLSAYVCALRALYLFRIYVFGVINIYIVHIDSRPIQTAQCLGSNSTDKPRSETLFRELPDSAGDCRPRTVNPPQKYVVVPKID